MSGASTPPVILTPIGADASSSYITNPMPATPTGSNAASIQQGFPPVTMQSELEGGEPPLGQDMNGFLYLISSHTMAVQCGQPYQYNSDIATQIGGYKLGTVLGMSDGTGLWLNTVDGNTTNPDSVGASGGWTAIDVKGTASVSGVTGGILTLTVNQYKYPTIVLTGALASNSIIQLPNINGVWRFINNTTGSYTVTVSTTNSGSSGTTISQGGYTQPTSVYCVGDGNIYPAVAPLSVSISQNADALTLAERTNAGYLLATYFNQNSSSTENPSSIDAVFVESGNDGFLRKSGLSNFISQAIGAVVVSGNNYAIPLPGGYWLLCGYASGTSGSAPAKVAVTFAKQLTTGIIAAACATYRSSGASSGSNFIASNPAPTVNGMTCVFDYVDSGGNVCGGYYIALGK